MSTLRHGELVTQSLIRLLTASSFSSLTNMYIGLASVARGLEKIPRRSEATDWAVRLSMRSSQIDLACSPNLLGSKARSMQADLWQINVILAP